MTNTSTHDTAEQPGAQTPQGNASGLTGELLVFVSPEQVSDAIKAAGCAVTAIEQDGVVYLHSASHGVGFQVLWGSALSPGQYADFTLSCPLRVQGGTLPGEVLADWHRTKRFARAALHGDFVALEMDVLAAGGISPAHLVVSIQLWTQMMGQFFLHLRNFKPAAAPSATDSQGGDTAVAASQGADATATA
ncbi:YbjN domain-containing protein [Polaromonas sp. YR568]|uniref:YbjN domain-containing protein n=1 Tax=Polaromonas sp. YR568 TaxID=1855301 RepID=UPI00398BE822